MNFGEGQGPASRLYPQAIAVSDVTPSIVDGLTVGTVAIRESCLLCVNDRKTVVNCGMGQNPASCAGQSILD